MDVIFNADDFGLTEGVNNGIVDAFLNGVVKSTTLMVGMDAQSHAVSLAKMHPALKIGLHLRLTAGQPMSAGFAWVQPNGDFIREWSLELLDEAENTGVLAAIEGEFRAQIKHFFNLGLPLSHIDSHHHVHLIPALQNLVLSLGEEFNVPVRGAQYGQKKYHFDDRFYDKDVSVENLLNMLNAYQDKADVVEVMCHPAFVDEALLAKSSYATMREEERCVLTSKELINQLSLRGFRVTDYSALC